MASVPDWKFPHSEPPLVTSYIDGRASDRMGNAHVIESICPATELPIALLQEADEREVDAAIMAARHAFDNGPWPTMTVTDRKAVMLEIRDCLLANADELAWLECIDAGLPMNSVRNMHVPRMAQNFEFFAEVANQATGDAYTQTPPYVSYVTHEPAGVAALIGPWNAPLALCSMKIASCIAFGNTCVLKPSEFTPLSLARTVELIHETSIPRGVVNLVNGRGTVTGATLVGHREVDMVSFTGGTVTGKHIMAEAAPGLKKVALELGGKSANIICANANLDRALDGALAGIYSGNGQQCLAGSRILVENSIADEFIGRFVERARNIRVDDPELETTELGPLCYEGHMERVLGYKDIALSEGAELLTGGKRSERHERGYFVEPTAVLAHNNATRVCQEEIFGPFATFLKYDDLDEAISIANDSTFGLVGYVWSDDMPTIMKVSGEIRAGTICVNTPMTRELRAPFGGYKESGLGRDSARDCLDFFTEAKTTTIPTKEFPLPGFGRGD
jgi:acyl-CoA reductase-like NAD-dependent aldehyde dehydrogenase